MLLKIIFMQISIIYSKVSFVSREYVVRGILTAECDRTAGKNQRGIMLLILM